MTLSGQLLRALLALATSLAVLPPAAAAAPSGNAPDFTLRSAGGTNLRLQEQRGRVVMINFWATWCGPCRQEMPLLEKLYAKYKPMGFTMLGVNVEPDSKLAAGFLEKTPVTFPILFDVKSEVSKLYQVAGMPSTAIVDRKGNLRWVHRGYKPGDENEYQNQIRALLRE